MKFTELNRKCNYVHNPHGKLEMIEYDSKAVGVKRKLQVYTPPGCSSEKKYPVLYLLHGLLYISQGVHIYLKEKGVPHVWNVDGNAHDATEWRNNLYYFGQKIFRYPTKNSEIV